MHRFLKRKVSSTFDSGGFGGESSSGNAFDTSSAHVTVNEVDLTDLPWDPSERKRIMEYHPDQRDEVRRKYLIRGPCQPRDCNFPRRMIGKKGRRFCPAWFNQYGKWLEYSVKVDKAFCLCCYLFRDHFGKQGGSEAFVTEGFSSWNKTERLGLHVGDVNSFHNRALKKCEDLMRHDQSIAITIQKQNDVARSAILKSASENNQMLSSSNEFDLANCIPKEVLKLILEEIGDDVFGLLVYEFSDTSKKRQMAVVLRYVDTCGIVKERFVGLIHVMDTSASFLKFFIESFFAKYGLSLKKVRAQGYDGTSNMHDEFNGLKDLILRENSSAYYVHCFYHHLQLVIVAIAKKHFGVGNFFDMIAALVNVVCTSCKRKDMIQESQKEKVQQAIGMGETETGRTVGEKCRGSYYITLLRLVDLFPSVVEVLEYVEVEGDNNLSQRQANGLQIYFKSFDFVYYLHLMLKILGLTDTLSNALQRKDQDLLDVISLVKSTKRVLHKFRVDGFDLLLKKISSFCDKHDIEMLNLNENYVDPKYRKQKTGITYQHYYEFKCFNTIVDMQIQELDDRFSDVSSELITCMAALNPCDSFCEFDPSKLVRLSELYPDDISCVERMSLEHQLDLYIDNVRDDYRFANLKGIADLARVMVETRKHLAHPLVYRLLKLALVLPIASTTITTTADEGCISAIKVVKSEF